MHLVLKMSASCPLVAAVLAICLSGCEDLSEVRSLGTLERDRIQLVADSDEPISRVLVREGDHVEPLIGVAIDGGGIALLPRYLCSDDVISSGTLCQVLNDWRSPTFRFYALYPSRRGVTLKLRAWLDFFGGKLNREGR